MRWLLPLGFTAACSAANPAFDLAERGDSTSAAGLDTGGSSRGPSTTTAGEGTSEPPQEGSGSTAVATESTSGGSREGTAAPSCDVQPSDGLVLAYLDPSDFGNTCPNGANVWVKLGVFDGEMRATTCAPGCTGCSGDQPLSASPLPLDAHVPLSGGECVRLETSVPLGHDGARCFWGALTIYDAANGSPYVIATSHSSDPTPVGAEILGDLIPEPEKAATCDCVTLGDACCEPGDDPAEFWAYPFAESALFPGEVAPIAVSTTDMVDHLFEVFQAESIPTCEGQSLQLSWAVVAKL